MLEDVVKEGITVRNSDFRIPEVEALASLIDVPDVAWSLPIGDNLYSPFWYIELPSVEHIKSIAQRSLLTKAFIEIWGEGSTFEELRTSIESCPEELKAPFYSEDVSFKVIVDGWGCKISQEDKVTFIEKLNYLSLKGKIDLKNPDEVYWLVISDPSKLTGFPGVPYRLYFGRQLAISDRSILQHYALPLRPYLGPTTMDAEMSFVMCNHAKVEKNSFVLDPFVGTGSILVAAAHHGAYTFGCDIDIKILKQTKLNKQNRNVGILDNFYFYNLSPPVSLLISDIYKSPFRTPLEMFDAVICDPPYGVRAGHRKLAEESKKLQGDNTIGGMCQRLVDFAAQVLKVDGRLVFFCPNLPGNDLLEEFPHHPMMKMVYCCEQYLSMKYSRCLITLQKTSGYDSEIVKEFYKRKEPPSMKIDNIHQIVFNQSKLSPSPGIPKFRCKQL